MAALARGGVVFTNAYTAGATCGPSRAALDSGLHTHRHKGRTFGPEVETLPRALADAGYVNSHPNGYSLEGERAEHEKWLADMGYTQPASSIYGVEVMAKYRDLPLKWKCGRAGVAPEHGFEAYCANRAIRFLETNKERPFACFLQLRGPHDPYMVPRPYDTMFDPEKIALPVFRQGEFSTKPPRQQKSFETQGASKMTDMQIREALALYYGMCAYSDHAAGLVLTRLRELGLDKNTVVILVSDHGDTMGRHRMVSKDFGFYEPAVRIPMVIRAPGNRPRGVMRHDPVSGVDVYPTLCDLMDLPKPKTVDGVSLVGRWEGREAAPKRSILAAQGTAGTNRMAMLRTPEFKFTRYDDGGGELYDLKKDPDELVNRFDDPGYAAVRGRLSRELAELDGR